MIKQSFAMRSKWVAVMTIAATLLTTTPQMATAAPDGPLSSDTAAAGTAYTGILIQAENEKTATVNVPYSLEEIRPAFRQGWTGRGDWYLTTGGDTLTYNFSAGKAASYALWVRDLDDGMHPFGSRTITILMDGVSIGSFPENTTPDSAFHWHKVADIPLTRGKHVMAVVKTQSTSAAALLDAFFLSRVAEVGPQ